MALTSVASSYILQEKQQAENSYECPIKIICKTCLAFRTASRSADFISGLLFLGNQRVL